MNPRWHVLENAHLTTAGIIWGVSSVVQGIELKNSNISNVWLWRVAGTMLQCLEGVKHLCGVLLMCCDIDLKQPKGLEDPEILARETVYTFRLPLHPLQICP